MKLWTVINNELVVNRNEIFLYKEFNYLWKRDKTADKLVATEEFKYIWLTCDFDSHYIQQGLDDEVIHVKAVKEIGLEEFYKPDEYVVAAQNKYREIRETPSMALLLSLLQGLRSTSEVVKSLNKTIKNKLQLNDVDSINKFDSNSVADNISATLKLIDAMNKIANDVPKSIKQISDLYDRVRAETSEKKMKAGGREYVGNREDVDYMKRFPDEKPVELGIFKGK
jgi:hypothetical protein